MFLSAWPVPPQNVPSNPTVCCSAGAHHVLCYDPHAWPAELSENSRPLSFSNGDGEEKRERRNSSAGSYLSMQLRAF